MQKLWIATPYSHVRFFVTKLFYIKRPTSIPVYVVGTALNQSELTSTLSAELSVNGVRENNPLPAN